MNPDALEALRVYIDARIDEALAAREEGADGYRQSTRKERIAREAAWANLIAVLYHEPTHD